MAPQLTSKVTISAVTPMSFSATMEAASPVRDRGSAEAREMPFATSPKMEPGSTWAKKTPIHVYLWAVGNGRLGASSVQRHATSTLATGNDAYQSTTKA